MSPTTPTTATVTQVVQVPMPLAEGLSASVLDIAFSTADGTRVTTTLPHGYGTPPAEGATIEILYDPRRPDDVRRNDPAAKHLPMSASRLPAVDELTQGQWISVLAAAAGAGALAGTLLIAARHDAQTAFIGVVFAAVLAGYAVARHHHRRWLRKHGVRVTGVVLGFQWHIRDRGGRRRRYRLPVVAFTTRDGQVTTMLRRAEPGMVRGQRVDLVYPPRRPADAVLASTLA